MPKKKSDDYRAPALTPETQENNMIALATRCAEKQMLEGTASSAIICHYLKLGTVKAQLELEKTKSEVALMNTKREAIENESDKGEMYKAAVEAMLLYKGQASNDDDENIF